jgi:hypothetical protein
MTDTRFQEIANGLYMLTAATRAQVDIPLEKLRAMQNIYFQRNTDLYSTQEINQINYFLKAVSFKFYLTILHLEQLWALSDNKRMQVIDALENSLDRLETSDEELLLISFAFEGFLLQARTFLDFYMLYICKVLKTGYEGSMSRKTFNSELRKAQQGPLAKTAEQVRRYFDVEVFRESSKGALQSEEWGTLLVSLRDKIAHRDLLRPSFNSSETLVGGVLFDWPTLKDTTYERLCQHIDNGMFELFREVSPILYGLEWKSGPYRTDMWQ